MKNLKQAIWVEMLKARRSKMPWVTLLGFMMIPLVGGFFMIILKDPEMARRAGLISTKAQFMAGVADWSTFLNLIAQAIAIGGIILFGFIASWVFGREYADRMVKDLLALPTGRSAVVLAKFVIVIGWSAILITIVYLLSLVVGTAVVLPPVPSTIITQGSLNIAISAGLTLLLVTPIAFFASAGHGYLPPMAATIMAIVLAQIIAVIGWGEYFPWTVPALISQGSDLGAVSYWIVIITSAAGLAGTFLWWELADQDH